MSAVSEERYSHGDNRVPHRPLLQFSQETMSRHRQLNKIAGHRVVYKVVLEKER
jgi:hypothetical protein